MRDPNYPDDIRRFDDDPRSPFFDGGDEPEPILCEGCSCPESECECDEGEE